jgi:hypothetical protein
MRISYMSSLLDQDMKNEEMTSELAIISVVHLPPLQYNSVYNPWLYCPLPECVIVAFRQKCPLFSPSPLEFSEWLNFTRTPLELIWSSLVNMTFGVWDHIPHY